MGSDDCKLTDSMTVSQAMRLADSIEQLGMFQSMTNKTLANLLLAAWSKMPAFSDKTAMLSEIIDRLNHTPELTGVNLRRDAA